MKTLVHSVEDASGFHGHADSFFAPDSAEELAACLARATRELVPVTIVGGRTGVTGGCVPQGGWAISTENLRCLEIHTGRAECGAGVPLADLHASASRTGQFYPPDPTETWASLGGTIATNASGSRSFRYGPTRDHVLALEVALMDGSLRRFERGQPVDFPVAAIRSPAARKNTAGFALAPGMDWVDLFTGSEGTLGVVTGGCVRLCPQPPHLMTGVVFFDGDDAALNAVDAWRAVAGLRMLEYMDGGSLDLLRPRFADIPAAAHACLLFEQELESANDETAEVDRWLNRLEAAGAGAEHSWFAGGDTDRERFRRFRHALPETINDTVRRRGLRKLGSDYAVPVVENGRMLAIYRERLDPEFRDRYVIFGHIGDAHVHVNLLPASREEYERGQTLLWSLAEDAVRLGGTVSAEHGLGKRKSSLLGLQYSPAEIDAMKAVKRRLDPHWLLGRGNVFGE